jgi:hypothetical protein
VKYGSKWIHRLADKVLNLTQLLIETILWSVECDANVAADPLFIDRTSDVNGKRYLVRILFPEKIIYDDGIHRTLGMNKVAQLIYLKNKELQFKKRDKNHQK